MAAKTKISWADSTCNLWIGCVEVSPACGDEEGGGCYAKELAERHGWTTWGGPRVHCKAGWALARKFQRAANDNGGVDPELGRRRRVFVNSLSDFFDNHKTVVWRDDAWQLIRDCPDVIFMLLTKRPENILKMLPPDWGDGWDNVWIGTTVENQRWANHRIPHLLSVPAVVHFLSMEPLLGEVDLTNISTMKFRGAERLNALTGVLEGMFGDYCATRLPALKWVITGGESGNRARPTHPAWFDKLRDDCARFKTPFVFKQWGEWVAVRDIPKGDLEGLYHPAPRRNPEATRRCKVPQAVLQLDGTIEDKWPKGAMLMFRVGRKRDPEHLAGRQHMAFPQDIRKAA